MLNFSFCLDDEKQESMNKRTKNEK